MSINTFISDIIKIDKNMGLELLKAIVYSSIQKKFTMEYSIDYGYYTSVNIPKGIPFLATFRDPVMIDICNKKPLPKEYIYKCIWFVHEYLCDKDYWKPFSTHDLRDDKDEDRIKRLIKYTSYDDNAMQSIYRYVIANWNLLEQLYNYLRNDFFKKQHPITNTDILPIEYNIEDVDKRYYKVYDAQIDMRLNKDMAILIRYGVSSKCKSDFDKVQKKLPHLLKGYKKMVFDLKTLTLVKM